MRLGSGVLAKLRYTGRMRKEVLAGVAVLIVQLVVVGSASAASTVADWQMNEPPGAMLMLDSGGVGPAGQIGSAVETGHVVLGETGYRFLAQDKDGSRPERLVTVDSPSLNPGTGDFAVTVRVYTGAGDQNIVQKGQSNTVGGFFKIDMLQGRILCTFRDANGNTRAIGSSQTIWDKAWHTVRCERRASGVSIRVDGGPPRTMAGPTGPIENSWPLSIGGKYACDPANGVACDYFVGYLDRVKVERLDDPPPPPPDTTQPAVAVTSPTDGGYVDYKDNVTVTASASDNTGVTQVDIWVNGSKRCTLTAAPYTCDWKVWTAPGKTNWIKAVAYDAAGNSSEHTIQVITR